MTDQVGTDCPHAPPPPLPEPPGVGVGGPEMCPDCRELARVGSGPSEVVPTLWRAPPDAEPGLGELSQMAWRLIGKLELGRAEGLRI